MSAAAERVAKGVEWLNENLGTDWPDFIDTDTLHMSSSTSCVLGQLFDSAAITGFYAVVSPTGLGMEVDWAEEYGFLDGFNGDRYVSFYDLEQEWLRVIDEYQLETA